MDNQHRRIKGYRELNQEEIDLMNKVKALGPQVEEVMNEVEAYLAGQHARGNVVGNSEERDRLETAEPQRWFALARTDLQVGLMKLTRSIAQPGFF